MKRDIPDIRDYSQKPVHQWTEQDRIASFEHAIKLVTKYTQQAILSTRGHVEALGMIMIKRAYMLLLQSGWQPNDIAMYSVSVIDEYVGQESDLEQFKVPEKPLNGLKFTSLIDEPLLDPQAIAGGGNISIPTSQPVPNIKLH